MFVWILPKYQIYHDWKVPWKSYRQKKKDCRLIVNRLWKRIPIRIYFLKMFPNWNTYPDWVIVLYYLEIATEYLYKIIIRLNLNLLSSGLKNLWENRARRNDCESGEAEGWNEFPLGNWDKSCILSGCYSLETALSQEKFTTPYKSEKK